MIQIQNKIPAISQALIISRMYKKLFEGHCSFRWSAEERSPKKTWQEGKSIQVHLLTIVWQSDILKHQAYISIYF